MGTELFKVTCVTCQASLSVRNPALVDQIIACPKCDSMGMIVAIYREVKVKEKPVNV